MLLLVNYRNYIQIRMYINELICKRFIVYNSKQVLVVNEHLIRVLNGNEYFLLAMIVRGHETSNLGFKIITSSSKDLEALVFIFIH